MTIERMHYVLKRALLLYRLRGLRYVYNQWWLKTFYIPSDSKWVSLLRLPFRWFPPYPTSIEIEVSTACPFKCTICEHTYWSEPSKNMSFEQLKSIVDQFKDMKFIALTGIGENFLNKDFLKMYRYIKSKWPASYLELYDNFFYLTEDMSKQLLDINLEKIIVSIEAATKETYEAIRVGSNFQRVLENIRSFIELKKERNLHFPEVVFHFIINKVNYHEIVPYMEMVKSLGGEKIFFTNMLHRYEAVEHLYLETENFPDAIRETLKAKAKELCLNVSWNWDTAKDKKPMSGCTLWYQPFVYVTGHVVPCCAMNEGNVRAFQKENALGNVFETSFRDLWYSDRFKTFRRDIARGKAHPLCQDCPIFTPKLQPSVERAKEEVLV
jgi:MoaA/NifB/PqqE/SkfB family radical SAM enzyme